MNTHNARVATEDWEFKRTQEAIGLARQMSLIWQKLEEFSKEKEEDLVTRKSEQLINMAAKILKNQQKVL